MLFSPSTLQGTNERKIIFKSCSGEDMSVPGGHCFLIFCFKWTESIRKNPPCMSSMCMAQQMTDPCRMIWWMEDKTKGFRISGLKKNVIPTFFCSHRHSLHKPQCIFSGTPATRYARKLRHPMLRWHPTRFRGSFQCTTCNCPNPTTWCHSVVTFEPNGTPASGKQAIHQMFFPSQPTKILKKRCPCYSLFAHHFLCHHFCRCKVLLTWGMMTSPSPKVGETLSPTVDNGSLTIQISVISVRISPRNLGIPKVSQLWLIRKIHASHKSKKDTTHP